MTQPAKVQEPSMEEILASIRRIIADDEAKPPAAEKPASRGSPRQAGEASRRGAGSQGARHERHSSVGDSRRAGGCREASAAAGQARAATSCRPAPAPVVSNNQDDIDALLNGLDEATTPEEIRPPLPDGEVFELTDDMAVPAPEPPQPSFHKVEPDEAISNLRKPPAPGRCIGSTRSSRRRWKAALRRSRYCRVRRCRRSNPRSIRLLTPCSATTRGRWKIWSRKCCGRC